MTECKSSTFLLTVMCFVACQASAMSFSLPEPADIGPKWKGGTGLLIDDFDNPPAYFRQSMPEFIKKFHSLGVKSVAKLAYQSTNNLSHQVNIEVFEFKSQIAAISWRKRNYGYADWQQDFNRTLEGGLDIYDSVANNKRAVIYQNYWITASTLSGDDHIMLVDKVIEQIRKRR